MPRSGYASRLGAVALSKHRAVDAQPHVAVAGRHDAAEAGAEPAGHAGLERELGRDLAVARTSPGPPRASPAGRTRTPRRRRRGLELVLEQLGDEAVVADAAVVGGHAARSCRSAAPAAWAASRKPSSVPARAPSSSCQIASGAIPTPPPTSSGARPSRGGAKPLPSGPTSSSSSPGAELAQPLVPGPTSSIRNWSSPRRPAARRTLNARGQERPLALSPAPPLGGASACRTGRRAGAGPSGSRQRITT